MQLMLCCAVVLMLMQLQPSCKHQALLARFHTAMASITAWRLMIRMQQSPQTATAAATAGSSREGDRASDSGQGQQQQPEEAAPAHTTAAGYAAGGCSSSALLTLTGYPLPLSLEALAGGSSGWCCGCVQVQQQEQSCWVRFNLPAALKQDSKVAQAADKELLVRFETTDGQAAAAGAAGSGSYMHAHACTCPALQSVAGLPDRHYLSCFRASAAVLLCWC